MKCEDREALWKEYNRALDIMGECVGDLEKPFTSATFGIKVMAAKAAKDICATARGKWEAHQKDHGCHA